MERIKEAARHFKLYPKVCFGEMRGNDRGNLVFFPNNIPHRVVITDEPTTVMINKNNQPVRAFKFIVEENGELYKWLVPLVNDRGEGHYLIDRLNTLGINVGDEVVLEMKKRGPRNYIQVTRAGEEEEEEEIPPDDDAHLAAAIEYP